MAMDKGVLSEAHPQFVGIYSGAASSPAILEAVEGADVVIDAGGVYFHDINTSAYSSRIPTDRLVTIDLDHVRIGDRIYNPVRMGDVFEMLARSVRKNFGYSAPPRDAPAKPGGKPNDPITAAAMYPRYRDFLKPLDQIVIENGSSTSGIVPLPLPDGAEVHSQTLWGSIGWATGATLGIALADPSRRTVLFTGEGSHQLTAVDVGTMGRNGLKPVIFVLNNEGYMVERARGESGLGLQRPRPLELSRPARRPGLPGLVHGESHHARRARRRTSQGRYGRIGELHRGRRRPDGLPGGTRHGESRLDAMYGNG